MANTNETQSWEKPSVTVDVLIFTVQEGDLKIILVKRAIEPYKGSWAIPGGFVRKNESLEDAALRELSEETGVKDVYLEQLYTFGDPKRDPRGRVVTVAYFALMPAEHLELKGTTDVSAAKWFPVNELPKLAFDHQQIVEYALERLRTKIQYSNITHGLMPDEFRLSELQSVYESILGEKLDKRNFRKKILSLGLLSPTGKMEVEGAHRPAMLYKFKTKEIILWD